MASRLHPNFYFSLLLIFRTASSQPFLGVNYGELADNLPSTADTAKLLRSTSFSKLRLYGVNKGLLQSLAHSNISVLIATSNDEIPSLASDPSAAANWVASNVLPFHPATAISTISVGNEVLLYGNQQQVSQLVSAMRNLHAALAARSLDSQIKISTVHSMSVLKESNPPSSGRFDADVVKELLVFLQETGSPFMVNPYPYFAYRSDSRPETLAFCLFQANPGRLDAGTNIRYMNMFDAQVDAVKSALGNAGYGGVEIVVAETGWPSRGGAEEPGASLENAKAYNGNLVAHLRSNVGTPLMPGRSVDTYLFALYDENQKSGPESERAFGLYRPDLSMKYDIDLARSSRASPGVEKLARWCVPKQGASDEQLLANLNYACGPARVDCGAIQPGGACFEPNTVAAHAAYAMNMLFQTYGKNTWNCDFGQTATISTQNPSYGSCVYPGS